jgi:hypothetical protein
MESGFDSQQGKEIILSSHQTATRLLSCAALIGYAFLMDMQIVLCKMATYFSIRAMYPRQRRKLA